VKLRGSLTQAQPSVDSVKGAEYRNFERWDSRSISIGLLALSLAMWVLVALQLTYDVRDHLPTDFQVYRNAAQDMLHAGATYHVHFTAAHLNFTYPPFALLIMSCLTVFPPLVSLAVWWLGSSIALVLTLGLVLMRLTGMSRAQALPIALALGGVSCLLLEPVRSGLDFGQINFFLMLAITADVLLLRDSRRGVLIGLVAAIKLTPLLYIAYFVVIRSRSSVMRAIGTFVAATTVAWIVLPSDSTLFWLHQAFSPGHKGGVRGTANQSLYGLVSRFSESSNLLSAVIWLSLCAVTVAVGLFLAQQYVASHRPAEAFLALVLTELLVSPVSWTHHWSWIVLLPVIAITKRHHDVWVSSAAMFLLLVAVVAPYRWHAFRWYDHGNFRAIAGFSLLLSGVFLMITMAATEWRKWRRHSTELSMTESSSSV
jgi:alpha-1,2-mannosyltransferase